MAGRKHKADNGLANALVIFVDIRGFTEWSDTPEVFASLDVFADDFNTLIRTHFPKPRLIKPLGDGAMIVSELDFEPNDDRSDLILGVLKVIKDVDVAFARFCEGFQVRIGQRTDLRLGWGVTFGKIKKLREDYVGSNVNRCARLCDFARPFGVVLDHYNFPVIPRDAPFKFVEQLRKPGGLKDVKVWVTPEIDREFVPREKLRQSPEVHVAGTCVRRRGDGYELLIAKRSQRRDLYPGLYEGCGGQLARNESFQQGVVRHFHREMKIEVRVLTEYHCFYEIALTDRPLMPGIRFLCEQVDRKDAGSPNHDDIRWVHEEEFRDMPSQLFVEDLKAEVLDLLQSYKSGRRT